MLGEIVKITENILMCRGENPDNNFLKPNISNVYVIRDGQDVFIIDTGAGRTMRRALKDAVGQLSPEAERLFIINTHAHVDHFSNNDIINEFDSFNEAKLIIHEAGKPGLDPGTHFLELFKKVDEYYDIFEGPPPPWRMLTRVFGMFNRESAMKKMLAQRLKKYEPICPAVEKMTFLKESGAEQIDLGLVTVEHLKHSGTAVSIDLETMKLQGWRVGNAVLINDGAHSPDHMMVYFPNHKLMITGDLTLELFPTWPGESSSKKIIAHIDLCMELAREGLIKILADSHHREPFMGPNKIIEGLKGLLLQHGLFKESLISLFKPGEKYTINDLYKGLRQIRFVNTVVDAYLENQFPRSPIFLKTLMANILVEEGFNQEGKGKSALFSLPLNE